VVLPSLEDPVRLEIFEARRETPAPPADESLLPSWRALRHDYLGERTTMDVLVDCDWLEERLDDEDLVVVDCGVRFEPPVSVTSGRADWSASRIRAQCSSTTSSWRTLPRRFRSRRRHLHSLHGHSRRSGSATTLESSSTTAPTARGRPACGG
jgi:hypothetical protein